MLAQLKIRDREKVAKNAEAGLAIEDTVREAAAERAREAREQAKAAQDEAGFWSGLGKTLSTVATVASVVAAAASVVCTGGASAPAILALAGTLLSASSPLVAKAAGDDAGKFALYGGMALSLGGAGAAALGKTAVIKGLGFTASPTVRAIGTATFVAARTTEGGARISEGYTKVREKRYEAATERSNADALAQRAEVRRSQAQVEELIEAFRELDASLSRALQTLAKVGDDQQQTKSHILSNYRRA